MACRLQPEPCDWLNFHTRGSHPPHLLTISQSSFDPIHILDRPRRQCPHHFYCAQHCLEHSLLPRVAMPCGQRSKVCVSQSLRNKNNSGLLAVRRAASSTTQYVPGGRKFSTVYLIQSCVLICSDSQQSTREPSMTQRLSLLPQRATAPITGRLSVFCLQHCCP